MPNAIALRPRSLPRHPLWPAAAALAAILALLMAFGAVVQSAVSQGVLRRQAQAIQSESMQRCRALHGKDALAACLAQSVALASAKTGE